MKKKTLSVLLAWLATSLPLIGTPAHAADSIVVGRSLALSGPLQSYGEAKRDGGDACIHKVNTAGGVAADPSSS